MGMLLVLGGHHAVAATFPPVANAISITVVKNSGEVAIPPDVSGVFDALAVVSSAGNGFARAGTDQLLYYRPVSEYSGTDTFTYTASNEAGSSAPATVTVTVNPALPIAKSSTSTVAANSVGNVLTLSLSGGPVDRVTIQTSPANGLLTVAGSGIAYTPTAGYYGTDSFSYSASNAGGTSQTATVTITVNPPPPIVHDVSVSVAKNSGTTLITPSVTGTYRSVVKASEPAHGSAWTSQKTMLGYTPDGNYSGSDSFTYTATNDGGTSAPATVYINVGAAVPIANNSSASVAANSSANVLALNLSGGGATSVALVTQADHGVATASGNAISYTPTPGYSGTDAFTYTATNASGTSTVANVRITVTPPTLSLSPTSLNMGKMGSAYNQILDVSFGTPPYVYALSEGRLPEGMVLGSITGTPTESGTFSFTVQATDVYGATGTQSYELTIAIPAPKANATSATVAANSSTNLVDLDTTGEVDSVAVVGQAGHGEATASGANIYYTPAVGYSGTDAFSYTATNTSGTSAAATVTVTVTAPTLLLTPNTLNSGTVGSAYGQTLASSEGTAPYTYTLSSGSLPEGLSLGSSGAITGTPTASGNFSFTIQSTDAYGATGAQNYVLLITPLPVPVANASSITVLANSNANPVALSITGAATSVAVATQALQGTATASSTGISISYTPVAGYSGADSFTYTASNASGSSAAAMVTIAVTAPVLMLSPSTLITGMVGSAYSQTLSASQGTAPYTYALSSGALPGGLNLGSDGVLQGTPTASDSFSFTIQATDAHGATGAQSYALFIAPLPVPVANPSKLTVAANSNANPVTLSITGAATSVDVIAQALHGTALASGASMGYTPTMGYSGTDAFTYTATNDSGTSAVATVIVTVSPPFLSIAPGVLPDGMVGTAYGQSLSASLGTAPYTYALVSGSLPGGLGLGSGGMLMGTPTTSGSFSFTIQATDAYGATGTQIYALLITPLPVPVANPSKLTVAANSNANPVTLSITGAATRVDVIAQALHGTAVASGASMGYTPAMGYSGADAFTYTATNGSGTSAVATVSVTVSPPVLSIAPGALPDGMVGAAYGQNLSASLGTAPYTYALVSGSLPGGLGLGSDGTLMGTPTASGSFSFTIQATDAYGATGTQIYALLITPLPVPVANPSKLTVAANSNANPVTLSITGAATRVDVIAQALHGTALASGASMGYTPAMGYSGADAFTYTATNGSGTSAAATVTVTVSPPVLSIAPGALPDGTVGAAYGQNLSASLGTAPYTYALVSGSLPGGLGLGSGGMLMGTPTTSGSFSFTIQATDAYGATGTQTYALLITPLPAPVANPSNTTVFANSSDNLVTLSITGMASSVAVATQAASGTATASGASIRYTPAAGYSGSDSFTYTATNASGTSAAATATIAVTAPVLMLSPSTLITGMVGSAYSQTLSASQGTAPYTYALSSGALPGGLSLGSDGALTGTPTASGSFSFTIQASDAHGATGTQSYALFIAPLPVPVANPSSLTVPANSNANPVTLSITGAAASVAVVTQALHGTALASGASMSYTPAMGYSGADSFTYTATNASGTSAAAMVSVNVLSPALSIVPGTLPDGMVGTAYGQSLSASLGTAPYTYALASGSLPGGLSLGSGGALTGTPTATGSFSFTIQATDAHGANGAQNYVLFIAPLPVPVANPSNATVFANSNANQLALSITGAAASVAVVTQALHGTALASGASIRYTPMAGYSGADSFTYTATNASGTSAAATVTIAVTAPVLALSPSTLPDGMEGTAYGQSLSASLGTAPYTYALASGSLPGGLSLGGGGALTGTPTATGSFSFTLQARDAYGATGTQSYALLIAPPPVPVANSASITVPANSSATPVTLSITGVVVSVAVATQAAHGTATASGSSISYMPTAGYSGSDSFTYTASNASGTSVAATVAVTVSPPTLSIAPGSLPPGTIGIAYGQHLSARLGTAPYGYTLAQGSLPAGISLSRDGQLSGTPTAYDAFDFTVQASDVYGATGLQRYTLAVAIQAPTAGPVSATVAANSSDNPIALQLAGGPVASVAVVSQAAHGTAKVSGTAILYTPTPGYSGGDMFSYAATNAGGSATATVTVTVTAPQLGITPAAGKLPNATEGAAYSQSLVASGGTAPYGFALSSGALPAGLNLSTGGLIAGTPQVYATGGFSFSVGVSDVYGATGGVSYTLAVGQMQPVAPSLSVTLESGSSVELDLTANAMGGPFSSAALLSLSPAEAGKASIQSSPSAGAAGAPGYLLRFTSNRSFSGAAVVVYTLSNTAGTSAPAQVHIQVLARSDPSKDAEVAGIVAAQTQSASRFASAQIANVATRLEGLHADGWGRSDFGLSLNAGSRAALPQSMPDGFPMGGMRKTTQRAEQGLPGLYASPYPLPDLPASNQPSGSGKQALTFWAGGAVDYGRQYVRGVDTEYRFTTSGISAGGDYRLSDLATLGLGLGLGRDSSLIGLNGSKSAADSLSVMLYGSLRPAKNMFVDGLLGYGRLRFDSTRYITDGGGLATGSRTGKQLFAAVVAGMEFRESGWMWSPYMRLELSRATLDTYSESAPRLAALTYFAQKTSVLSGVLGLRAEGIYNLGEAKLVPKTRLEYTHSLRRDGEAGLAYADLADLGPAYSLGSNSFQSGSWTLGLGLRLLWRKGLELSLELSSSIDINNNRNQGLSLGLRVPF
ncbi:Ig-like domain-containing protein [Comamonas sp. GB3 AK4-5]|uniref:Ig-like domain-containing protein n=1 Tax=Comamonas sp. GB3 AK4-5 TaxID=3231487 RepID=UPI00351E7205